MLKNYIKIAWKVLLRRKFFTFVSLFGISFTLLVLMVVAAILSHMFAPARPGSKFDRTLYTGFIEVKGENTHAVSYPSYLFLDRYVRSMKRPEAVSLYSTLGHAVTYVNNQKLELQLKYTDAVFWDILEFDFLDGRPFDQNAVDNAEHVAVINDRLRKQAFGARPAVGEYLETTEGTYRIVGVIPYEEIPGSPAFADMYLPVTTSQSAMTTTRIFSNYNAFLLAADKDDFDLIKSEFAARLAQAQKDYAGEWNMIDCGLGTQFELATAKFLGSEMGGGNILFLGGIVGLMVLFMLFPAINLININASRIIERTSEIGIRKAFGASSRTLVGQFVVENIVLTLIGGAIAFVLSFFALSIINDSGLIPHGQFGMNIQVFIYCLGLCLFFGLFSGALPAYRMSRLHPVEALKGIET